MRVKPMSSCVIKCFRVYKIYWSEQLSVSRWLDVCISIVQLAGFNCPQEWNTCACGNRAEIAKWVQGPPAHEIVPGSGTERPLGFRVGLSVQTPGDDCVFVSKPQFSFHSVGRTDLLRKGSSTRARAIRFRIREPSYTPNPNFQTHIASLKSESQSPSNTQATSLGRNSTTLFRRRRIFNSRD